MGVRKHHKDGSGNGPVSVEELKQKLIDAGYDPSNPKWVHSPAKEGQPFKTIIIQREMMTKVRELLTAQLENDINKLEEAREELHRKKKGGAV